MTDVDEREPPTDTQPCGPDAGVADLQAVVQADHVDLQWTCAATNEDGFVVERRIVGDIVWGELARLPANVVGMGDFNIQLDQRYAYRVRVFRIDLAELCESDNSPEVEVTTAPRPPEQLTATLTTSTEVELGWRDVNRFEDGHTLQLQVDQGGWTEGATLGADSQATTFDLTGLNGQVFEFRVLAHNPSGSAASEVVRLDAPAAPVLEFTGPATLSDTCLLDIPGQATFDSAHGAAFASAQGSIERAAGEVEADQAGIRATLNDLDASDFAVGWTVTDTLGGQSTLDGVASIDLVGTSRGVTRRPRAVAGDDMVSGRQALMPGCSRCTGTRAKISAGDSHTCALMASGRVTCWGDNYFGQTGNGGSEQPRPMATCSGDRPSPCAAPLSSVASLHGALKSPGHMCARMQDGTLRCWGDNQYGQLGTGDTTDRAIPTPVCVSGQGDGCTPLSGVVDMAAGYEHTCAVTDEGIVWCWGRNFFGQLGTGDTTDADTRLVRPCIEGIWDGSACVGGVDPRPVEGIVSIAAGERSTCALASDQRVLCWGDNDEGQLGDGTNSQRLNPVAVCATGAWDGVQCTDAGAESGLTGVAELAAGNGHTCALMADGDLRCWGDGYDGQLGTGEWNDHSLPVSPCMTGTPGVDCVPIADVRSVSVFDSHTCAVTGDEQAVWCWGENFLLQLGNDDVAGTYFGYEEWPVPVCVQDVGADCTQLQGVREVVLGVDFSCGIRAADGAVLCWGDNYYDQLGRTTVDDSVWVPQPVCGTGPVDGCEPFDSVEVLGVGYHFACAALGADRQVQCWGAGKETMARNKSWGPTAVAEVFAMPSDGSPPFLEGIDNLDAGVSHTCFVGQAGDAQCVGWNYGGQLGMGHNYDVYMPGGVCASWDTDPPDEPCEKLDGVVALSSGYQHTCAVMRSGRLKCWGMNDLGQMGIGSHMEYMPYPFDVLCGDGSEPGCDSGEPLTGVVSVASGDAHTCALLSDGRVLCWGWNEYGQLGIGSQEGSFLPVQVPIDGVLALDAGPVHTCALVDTGHVYCWGDNRHHELGYGIPEGWTDNFQVTPVRVCRSGHYADCDPLDDVVAIALGWQFSCALRADGRVWCWGSNADGQMGNGTIDENRVAAPVCAPDPTGACDLVEPCDSTLEDVVALTAGAYHVCAMSGDGLIWCWGGNYDLQLGCGADWYACRARLVCPLGLGSEQCEETYGGLAGLTMQTCELASATLGP